MRELPIFVKQINKTWLLKLDMALEKNFIWFLAQGKNIVSRKMGDSSTEGSLVGREKKQGNKYLCILMVNSFSNISWNVTEEGFFFFLMMAIFFGIFK